MTIARGPAPPSRPCGNIRRVRRLLSSALILGLAPGLLAAPAAAGTGQVRAADGTRSVPSTPRAGIPAPPASPDDIDATIERAFALVAAHRAAQAERLLLPVTARGDLTNRQRARAERALGQSYVGLGRLADASSSFSRALEIALAASDRQEAGWARRGMGSIRYGDGRLDEARVFWNAAQEDFVAVGDARGQFEVLDDMALAGTAVEKRIHLERALQVARDLGDPVLEARARHRWGQALLYAARPGPALVELERAVELLRGAGTPGRGNLSEALSSLAWALRAHGSNDRAVIVQREALGLALTAGDLDAQVWNYFGLGIALVELRRFDEADAAMRRGRAAAARTGNLTTIRILAESEGWIAMKKGDWARAVPAIEASIARPGVELTAMPLVNLAQAYRHVGRPNDALSTATRGVEVARRLGAEDNELQALIELAEAQVALGDLPSAEATLRQVTDRLEGYRAALAPNDFLKQGFGDRFGDAYGIMVHVLMMQGRARDALAAAERVRSRAFADLLAARRARETEDAQAGRWLLGGEAGADVAPAAPADSPRSIAALDADGLGRLADSLATTIVIYWLHETGSYAWVVGANGEAHGVTIPMPARLVQRLVRQAVDVAPEVEVTHAPGAPSSKAGARARRLHAPPRRTLDADRALAAEGGRRTRHHRAARAAAVVSVRRLA